MENVIIIRYGEIFLKGKNFGFFEKTLVDNIEKQLDGFDCVFNRLNKRFYISGYEQKLEKKIIEALRCVFGIHSLSPAVKVGSSVEEINNYVSTIKLGGKSFRVSVNSL